jgi:hypothetical protein
LTGAQHQPAVEVDLQIRILTVTGTPASICDNCVTMHAISRNLVDFASIAAGGRRDGVPAAVPSSCA